MAIEATATVDLIETDKAGNIQIRFLKRLRDTVTGEVVEGWHRTSVQAGQAPTDQIAAVSAHLQDMGLPAIIEADAALIRNAQSAKPSVKTFERDRAAPVRTVVDDTDRRTLAERKEAAFPVIKDAPVSPGNRR